MGNYGCMFDVINSGWHCLCSFVHNSLSVAVYLMLFCAQFGLISETIKDRFHLTQSHLAVIGVMGRFGAGTTIIPGIFCNYYGPSRTVWLGILIITSGWGALTLFVTEAIDISSLSYSYIIIGLCNFLYLHGIAAPCIAQNFPKQDHGKLLGLAKGYLGLGSAFVAIWKTDLADNANDTFMIEYLIFLPIFGCIFAWFLILLPSNISNKYFKNELNSHGIANYKPWYALAVLFVCYLGCVSIIQDIFTLSQTTKIFIFLLSQIIWLLPWLLAIFCHGPFFLNISDEKYLQIQNEQSLFLKHQSIAAEEFNLGMPQIFATIEFWLMFIPFIIVSGCGLAFISNVAQIIESASSTADMDDKNENIASSLVTIISIGNFTGRVIVGYVSDHFRDKFHRVFWILWSCIFMFFSMLFIYFVGTSHIWYFFICALCIGMSYGWLFSTAIASCSDLWGTRYLSGNYAALDSAPAFGQVIFSNLIFANLYQSAAQNHSINGDDTKCYGDVCYKYTFLICAGASLIAFCMALCLWIIVKKKNKRRH